MSQEFRNRLRDAINICSKEIGSNTPDFILVGFLAEVLDCWDRAVTAREKWYGRAKPALVFKSKYMGPWTEGNSLEAPAASPDSNTGKVSADETRGSHEAN